MAKSGWFKESHRHALAARGIESGTHAAGKQLLNEFQAMRDSAELRALSKVSLERPLSDSEYDRMMKLGKAFMKDSDKDGVPDKYDCSPHDPSKQDYGLEPRYDSRKSFYGKAEVRDEDGKQILRSYNTDVAYIKDGKAVVNGTYSQTTLRHIKEFLKQNGFKAETSAQILKDYSPKEGKSEESEGMGQLRATALVAKLGDVFGETQKEKNDWKARMLKAGLGQGLEMPEDWDRLDEKTKEQRLDKAIAMLRKEDR